MAPEKIEKMLTEIDKLVGRPEDESPDERRQRAEHFERRARRKAAGLAA